MARKMGMEVTHFMPELSISRRNISLFAAAYLRVYVPGSSLFACLSINGPPPTLGALVIVLLGTLTAPLRIGIDAPTRSGASSVLPFVPIIRCNIL